MLYSQGYFWRGEFKMALKLMNFFGNSIFNFNATLPKIRVTFF